MQYPATYEDKLGKTTTSFLSGGDSLQIQIRGYSFSGLSFEYLEPEEADLVAVKSKFSLDKYNCLTDCIFEISIPVNLANNNKRAAVLQITIVLENDIFPRTREFAMFVDKQVFSIQDNNKGGMWFESQMIRLQRLLPRHLKMNTCIFCAYSNYSVYGSESFGTLRCFKEIKDIIVHIDNKDDYVDVSESNGTPIQETFWCDEYSEITKDQWQYKDPM